MNPRSFPALEGRVVPFTQFLPERNPRAVHVRLGHGKVHSDIKVARDGHLGVVQRGLDWPPLNTKTSVRSRSPVNKVIINRDTAYWMIR